MGTVTLQVRTILTTALAAAAVLLLVVAAYAMGGAAQGTAPVASAATDDGTPAERTIEVVGKGTATAVPDQVAFTVTATAKRDDLDDALAAANAAMSRALASLAEQGVAERDTRTTGLTMSPEYDYPRSGPRVFTGYRVTQRLRVTVTELANAGGAITAVVESGDGVSVGSIALVVGDPEAAIAEARDAAVAEATAKAEQYAAATGATLAEVLTVREVSAPGGRPQPVAARAAAFDLAAVPIRAGESDLTVRVQVVWSLS